MNVGHTLLNCTLHIQLEFLSALIGQGCARQQRVVTYYSQSDSSLPLTHFALSVSLFTLSLSSVDPVCPFLCSALLVFV